MAHREFTDANGVMWQAWEVIPSTAERRNSTERRFGSRDQRDRRVTQQLRAKMHDEMVQGWLVFESVAEKRRLHPIPAGWSELSDRELVTLAQTGEAATRSASRPHD